MENTEMKLRVSNGRIVNAWVQPDGTCSLEIEMPSKEEPDLTFSDMLKIMKGRIIKGLKNRY